MISSMTQKKKVTSAANEEAQKFAATPIVPRKTTKRKADVVDLEEVERRRKKVLPEAIENQVIVIYSDSDSGSVDLEDNIYRLLHSRGSELAAADLKRILQDLINTLPAEDLAEAAKLLPWTDKNKQGGVNKHFASPSNVFFWESVKKWQDVLSLGGFEERKKNEGTSVQKNDLLPFKDEAYEEYWGQRLETNRRLRASKEKKRSNRGCRRARGRGRRAN